MRKLFLSVVVALFMNTAFAVNTIPVAEKSYDETFKELAKMLNSYSNLELSANEVVVKVKITINDKHEIVVMSTDASDSDLNYYIKNSLNYQKLSANELEVGSNLVFLVKFAN